MSADPIRSCLRNFNDLILISFVALA